MLVLDHIAVLAETLEEAAGHVESALGLPLVPGGKHEHFGTHNRLLGLGGGLYIEAIAIDPASPPPPFPRWFGLDAFYGGARLDKWICRVDDLQAALEKLPVAGRPVRLARGALEWSMAVPEDGMLPFDGLFPALIEWHSPVPPGVLDGYRRPDSRTAGCPASARAGAGGIAAPVSCRPACRVRDRRHGRSARRISLVRRVQDPLLIRTARRRDAADIAAIWNQVIRDTAITFTTEAKTVEGLSSDIAARGGAFQVAEIDGTFAGFATYGAFRSGPGYACTKEHSIMLAAGARRQGAGRALMEALQAHARHEGVHSLWAGISSENPAAIPFHAALGFVEIARLPQVGYKFGRWMDLVLMQKML